MPPKKKVKSSQAKAIASGVSSRAVCNTLEDVCPLMRAAADCVESMHCLRHSGPTLPPDAQPLPELPLDREKNLYPWPCLTGGTLKDIAQRAWLPDAKDQLLEESWAMVKAAGLLDDDSSTATLKEKFCSLEARPFQKPFCLCGVSLFPARCGPRSQARPLTRRFSAGASRTRAFGGATMWL